MPRPETSFVTLTIDGREIRAPEGAMLVDGARHGDVEIPYFCYEPKLGPPVGACRMCLVEVEGIPKLQTACSTPVKDGMVVNTETDRVRSAQQAVVEFLLINHPLDCPVCDKGGECPLQDITFGWGAGTSRFIEPKRHFRKPLELSPLVAIDRERCILCYRCVRFSQDVAEDYQLVLHERGAHTFVGTFDGHPYVGPFTGNVIELCPVGALTSTAYRFRARPWDIEAAGSVCTLCPAQCNVSFTVRDERVMRVTVRDNAEVDDGWLCDKGRFGYQSIHVDERITQPMMRDAGELRPVSWEKALDAAASGLERAKGKVGGLAGGQTTNEEGFLLQRLLRDGLGSPHLDSRAEGAEVSLELARALAAPAMTARTSDLEFAHAVLVLDCEPVDDAPVLDLRIRKGVNRRGVKLAVASNRSSALDPNADVALRFAPGGGEALLGALDAVLGGAEDIELLAASAGASSEGIRQLATLLGDAGEDVVILWGDRMTAGARADHAVRALLNVANRLGLGDAPGGGLLEIPTGTNGRGLREAGVLPNAGPGYREPQLTGFSAQAMARAAVDGELTAFYLLHADPLRSQPDRALWDRALGAAGTVIAHAQYMTDSVRDHATVVFPAEAYAEKEGTLVHPDGRLQRVRQAIGRPAGVRPEWQVIAELASRCDHDLGVLGGPALEAGVLAANVSRATGQLIRSVPFYAGITLEEIAGKGVRWADREPALKLLGASAGSPEAPQAQEPYELERPPAAPSPDTHAANGNGDGGSLRLGTFRSLWASPEVEASPALKFLSPTQRVELSPRDAERLGVGEGDEVEVARNGSALHAAVSLRSATPAGTAFLAEATRTGAANTLTGDHGEALVHVRLVSPARMVAGPDGAVQPESPPVSGTEGTGSSSSGDTPTATGPQGEIEQ